MALKTIAGLGDSKLEMGTDAFKVYKTKSSLMSYVEMISNGRWLFRPGHNFGVSSERIDQIALRVDDVYNASPKPTYCLVWAGTNDLLQNAADSAATLANRVKTDILIPLETNGVAPIVMSLERNDANSIAMNTKRIDYNGELQLLGRPYAPVAEHLDRLSAVGSYQLSGLSYDGTHPSPWGYYEGAKPVVACLTTVDLDEPSPFSNLAPYGVGGTGGALAGGAGGLPPTNFTLTGPEVTAQSGLVDGFVPENSTSTFATSKPSIASMGLAVGNEIYADVDFDLFHQDLDLARIDLRFFNAGFGQIEATYWGASYLGNKLAPVMRGRARVGPYTIPANTVYLDLVMNWVTSTTRAARLRKFQLYDFAIRKTS